ncbi:MAG: D-alanyl-D-alanine carboxypeptidase [Clostridia bacterium]|nr:D-alanyl-D-alanine carboxypeptidase [Clostridia bacterium]
MKKFLSLLLAALFVLCCVPMGISLAEFDPNTADIPTHNVILVEASTGAVLYAKDPDEQVRPASTTKIMTCIVALENGDLDATVTCGREVDGFSSGSSLMGLSNGERIELRELLYGLMMRSGNDAAAAIAVHIGGSIEGFADMMNEKAAELGMTGTHFVNPHGMDKDAHYTTVADMAKLTSYALNNGDFRAIVGRTTRNVEGTNRRSSGYQLENSNKLIHTKEGNDSYEYRYAIGVKTGDTPKAGRCLVAAAEKDGVRLVSVQYGDFENEGVEGTYRFELAANLFNWGFENFTTMDAALLNLPTTQERSVNNSSFEDPENGMLTLNADLTGKTVSGLKADLEAIAADPSLITVTPMLNTDPLVAPISAGEVVGSAVYQYNGRTLLTADLVASRDVAELSTVVHSPSSNPLVLEELPPDDEKGSSLLFWILLVIAILAVIIVIRILKTRRSRRRNARRRRGGSYVYRRK